MNKVKLLLEQRNWTVSDLMRKSGLAMGTVHSAANDPDWPTDGVRWGIIKTIAHALDVSPEYLVSENNNA